MPGSTLVQKRELLKSLVLFSRLDEGELDAVAARARIERHPAGEQIFAKGSPGLGMMSVLRGQVLISSTSPAGKEIVLNIIKPGEVFGEIALLDGLERTADATAMSDCELLVLDRRDFLPMLLRRADFCVALLELVCRRLRQTSLQVEDALFERLDIRIAKVLIRLVGTGGEGGRQQTASVRLSQQQLGNMVGASRESVNRQLRAWQREGLVALTKGSIVIRDLAELERLTPT
jgi:CRP/FNR family transcriptional regulator, cyclic AMP receptor protein